MLISPEVRNAIHVGDRILEINGLPVGTLMEDEVSVRVGMPECCPVLEYGEE